ncbi:MAG: OB-fold nucleic acid binding domain-containing protein [Nanoarchaeota archaeon]
MVQRQVAYKVWIQNIVTSPFIEQAGEWDPNYIAFQEKQVSRVNIIATIVEVYQDTEKGFANITVDDGSATIRVKAFKDDLYLIKDCKPGDLVNVIGRIRKYQDEVYLSPEIVAKLSNPNWELLRKAELLRDIGKYSHEVPAFDGKRDLYIEVAEQKQTVQETLDPSAAVRQKILTYIEKQEESSIQGVIGILEIPQEEAQALVKELLKDGEIYQSRPGYVRLV